MNYKPYFLIFFGGVFIFLLIKSEINDSSQVEEFTTMVSPSSSGDQRYQHAVEQHTSNLVQLLDTKSIPKERVELFLRAFKAEKELEVWVKTPSDQEWQLLKKHPFCKSSGTLGPKRKEGDLQIPEGIYHIDRFNPKGDFHLSLGLNYPNPSDRILGDPQQPGSDIFIHGGCVTVGCIPITNIGIEELYVLAKWAKSNGQDKIPVHIFPFRFDPENWKQYGAAFPQHEGLWKNLEAVYTFFETERRLPIIEIGIQGSYESTD